MKKHKKSDVSEDRFESIFQSSNQKIKIVKKLEKIHNLSLHNTFTFFSRNSSELLHIIKGVSRSEKHFTILSRFFNYPINYTL